MTRPLPNPKPEDSGLFEVLPWEDFCSQFQWNQGEHVTMIGTTGYGKSTLAQILLQQRKYVVAFATKRKDETMDKFEASGYKVQKRFEPETANRIILKPKIDPDDDQSQRGEFDRAMTQIFWQGGWCMHWDEAAWLSDHLKLNRKMAQMLMQGRSLHISCVTCTQRPAFIPTYAYDMPTHFFFWKMKLDRDVERVARLGGLDLSQMTETIRQLPKFYTLYHNKDSDLTVITKPEV